MVRCAERKWRKYKETHHWTNFKKEQRNYYNKVNFHKKLYMTDKVLKSKGNSKELHRIVTELCGDRKQNPLPDHNNDKSLASEFLDFFINKIETIRNNLDHHAKYKPPKRTITHPLSNFTPIDQKELQAIVNHMKPKSCELDAIPTKFIKDETGPFMRCVTLLCKYFTANRSIY